MRARVSVALFLTTVFACDATPASDAGPSDATADVTPDARADAGGAFEIAAPALPAPPSLGPCEDGWVSVDDEAITLCLPWADGEPPPCTGATFAPPGEARCVAVGEACPGGDFPDVITAPEVVYVRPGGTGDGSRADPYGSLADVGTVAAGGVIVLSRGTHDSSAFQLQQDVTLRGACTSETIITRTSGTGLFLGAGRTGSRLTDLTIRDLPGVALVAYSGGEVTVERVVIERARQIALRARTGSALTARDVVVRDTAGRSDSGANGMSLSAEDGSTVTVERAVLDGARQAGVVASGAGTTVALDRVSVLRTRGTDADGAQGAGIFAQEGARIDATRTAVVENRFMGIGSNASTVTCDRCFVARTRLEGSTDSFGEGVVAVGMGQVTLTRSVIDENQMRAVWSAFDGSRTQIEDSVIRDVVPQAGGEQGRGLHAYMGGSIVARRVAILRTVGHAVSATSGSSYDVEDVIVVDVVPRELDGSFGRGFSVVDGSTGRVARASLDGYADMALMVATGAEMDAEDLTFAAPEPGDYEEGRIIQVQEGAIGTFARVAATGWRYMALTCIQDATCTIEDASFRDGDRERPSWVRGFGVLFDSVLQADRVEVVGATSIGAFAIAGGVAHFRDLLIEDIAACTEDCIYQGGTGIATLDGGEVTVDGFVIGGASFCGVHLDEGASLDLRNGRVYGSRIGICLQAEGYDIARLQMDVVFQDNTTNLDSVMLPLPQSPNIVGDGS